MLMDVFIHVVVPVFKASTLQSLCGTRFLAFFMVLIDFRYKCTPLIFFQCENFSQAIWLHIKGICFFWTNFISQIVALARYIILVEYFSQTICHVIRGNIFHLTTYLRLHVLFWEAKTFIYLTSSITICPRQNDWQLILWWHESIFPFQVVLISLF